MCVCVSAAVRIRPGESRADRVCFTLLTGEVSVLSVLLRSSEKRKWLTDDEKNVRGAFV